jgi:pyruvate kinase
VHARPGAGKPARTEDAIGVAVVAAAELLHCPLIVCFTSSGFTARKVATYRPTVPIFAATPEPETFQQLSPGLGHHSRPHRPLHDYDSLLREARQAILPAASPSRESGWSLRPACRSTCRDYQSPED